MKKWIALAAILLLEAVGLFFLRAPQWRTRAVGYARGESFHRGMPTHYWLDNMSSTNANMRYESILALDREKVAIPALSQRLDDEIPLLRQMAALALGRLGADAKEAVPALTKMMKDDADPSSRRAAEDALKNIDPSQLPKATPQGVQ
ncbi:MAG: HEAT repeat domain-containing protein [Gemmataceae bacterium]